MQDTARKLKEEVAEAAISLFKRNGYNNVTVNEICKECGISRSVFYSSFWNTWWKNRSTTMMRAL